MTNDLDAEVEAFTITFRQEVLFYLRKLINDQEPITVMYNEGADILLTMLLDLDEEEDTLIFDWGGSESANQALQRADHAYFVANPVGVRNQFMTTRVWSVLYEGKPALATRIPDRFVRLQRREFFRLTVPLSLRISCRVPVGNGSVLDMKVVDIGLGGVCLEAPNGQNLPFVSGQKVPRVSVGLVRFGSIDVTLETRYVSPADRDPREPARMGCSFVGLSSKQENELQRFITQVQCDERARR